MDLVIVNSTPERLCTGTAIALLFACAKPAPPAAEPAPVSVFRGVPAQAALLSDAEQVETYRTLVRDFFRPTGGQARWIDPRLLPHRRDAADSLSDDTAWLEELVPSIGLRRVCALDGPDHECRGRHGGVLRFSLPYAASTDTIRVFARYVPVAKGEDPAAVANRVGFEEEFSLTRRNGRLHISRHRTVGEPR